MGNLGESKSCDVKSGTKALGCLCEVCYFVWVEKPFAAQVLSQGLRGRPISVFTYNDMNFDSEDSENNLAAVHKLKFIISLKRMTTQVHRNPKLNSQRMTTADLYTDYSLATRE